MLTPNEADIPKPVPGEISLAGSARPDISRFLNVRTAVAPSLSPDGARLTFLTGTTGSPQLWVVDSRGGWPGPGVRPLYNPTQGLESPCTGV
jgi:hypothetical protein